MKRLSILIALAVMLMAVSVMAGEQPADATSVTVEAPVIVEAEGSYEMPWGWKHWAKMIFPRWSPWRVVIHWGW